jgi:hypothetical protein
LVKWEVVTGVVGYADEGFHGRTPELGTLADMNEQKNHWFWRRNM